MPRSLSHSRAGRAVATLLAMAAVAAPPPAAAPLNAYNPYADTQNLPPVAPDGTLRWGTFYKSAAIQQAYERLWNLGACRNTNKAITIPVEMNKVAIDSLPEEDFRGVVVGSTGTIRGGMIAFTTAAAPGPDAPTHVAALHPAGVSKLTVSGPLPVTTLRPGLTVRVRAEVDSKGVGTQPLAAIDVITPPPGFKPVAIQAGRVESVVGTVVRRQADTLVLQVPAGRIRRLSLPIAPDAVVSVDAAQVDLVAPGDIVTLTGRVWRGEGCLGEGTVFASVVTVAKQVPAQPGAQPQDAKVGAP